VHWSLSFLGAVGCLAVMFLINAVATVAAATIVGGFYFWLRRREMETTWGDVRSGVWMSLMRTGLLRAPARPDPRSWRPHLLVLSGSPSRRWPLIEFCSELSHNRGLMTIASVLPAGSLKGERRREMERTVREFLERRGVQALSRIVTAEDPYEGSRQLVQSYGLGRVSPDTVVIGLREQEPLDGFVGLLAGIHDAHRNLVLFADGDGRGFRQHRRIDVWWGGLHANGGLMLILAYLLRSGIRWRESELRLNLMVDREEAFEPARENLERVVKGMRITATCNVVLANGRSFEEVLLGSVTDTDLLFLGMAEPGEQFPEDYRRLLQRAPLLPPTAYVLATDEMNFSEVLIAD
jgi:hypothetical protein